MGSRIAVDGLVLPKQVAGHPALELVNTRAGWGEAPDGRHDYLTTFEHLVALARLNDLVDDERAAAVRRRAARRSDEADEVLARSRGLRGDLHDVLTGSASRAAADRLSSAITGARARQRLEVGDGVAAWRFAGRPDVDEPLAAFLLAAGDLLVGHPNLGACPGHGCGWLFLNPSGRRRWCQMAVCGNRAKQASHAARARA
jgi:predicted RNA-binding Zn ribbon-like protein